MIERCALPEWFSDNSIQERFQPDEAFSSSVAREMALLFSAADASDLETARALTREARALMRARHDRSFVGEDRCLREAEDLWLTLEGTGQWVGYEWLLHPEGAGATPAAAMSGFGRRSRWWSQNLGLALVRALHRLDGGGWKRQAFVNGEQTVMQMWTQHSHMRQRLPVAPPGLPCTAPPFGRLAAVGSASGALFSEAPLDLMERIVRPVEDD